ncbi:MAG: flagellar biosynthesis anti-sigma factor FlgM [bacterium]
MKIEGQYPKLPVQDKNVHKDKTAFPIENKTSPIQDKSDPKKFAVNKIRERIDAEPEMDMEKIRSIKARIKSGEYEVDTKKLANNLLKDSLLEDL